jgi:hypothetical protein
MRDIREDLRERLQAIAANRAALQKQMDALDASEANVKSLLADEESRVRSATTGRPELPFERVPLVGGMTMTDLIKATLRIHDQRLTFDEVRDEILKTRFDFTDQKPGRVVHGGLLSLMRTREIDKDGSGRYGFPGNNGIPVQGE